MDRRRGSSSTTETLAAMTSAPLSFWRWRPTRSTTVSSISTAHRNSMQRSATSSAIALLFELIAAGQIDGLKMRAPFRWPLRSSRVLRAVTGRLHVRDRHIAALLYRHREDPVGERRIAPRVGDRRHHRLRFPGPRRRHLRGPPRAARVSPGCTRPSPAPRPSATTWFTNARS